MDKEKKELTKEEIEKLKYRSFINEQADTDAQRRKILRPGVIEPINLKESTKKLFAEASHGLLSQAHGDTWVDDVSSGDLIIGKMITGVIKWAKKVLGASGTFLRSDGNDALWTPIITSDLPQHASRHKKAGDDLIKLDDLDDPDDNTDLDTIPTRHGLCPKLPDDDTKFLNGKGMWTAGAGGEVNTGSNQGVGGIGVFDAKVGVDLQFRNVNAKSSKIEVSLDAANKEVDIDVVPVSIKLDDLGTPDDNTDLDVSITRHGLCPKAPDDILKFLNGIGGYSVPAGGGGGGGDSTYKGAYGARPAPGNDGDLYFPTDGVKIYRDTGAAWEPWGPLFPFKAPVDGDFAWVNQGTGSVDTTYGGIYLLAPALAGDQLRVRIKSAPSTPYIITAAILFHMHLVSHNQGGLCFRQSSDGKLHTFNLAGEFQYHGQLCSTKWNSASSYNSHYLGGASGVSIGASFGLLWLRIADDGANRKCSWSANGRHWHQFHSVGRTDFLIANQVGFFATANNALYPSGIHLLSWEQS